MNTRNAVNPDMSREMSTMYGQHVPTGCHKSALLHVNTCFPIANTYLIPDNAVPTCRAINKLNYLSC